jgi:hypothetical protein
MRMPLVNYSVCASGVRFRGSLLFMIPRASLRGLVRELFVYFKLIYIPLARRPIQISLGSAQDLTRHHPLVRALHARSGNLCGFCPVEWRNSTGLVLLVVNPPFSGLKKMLYQGISPITYLQFTYLSYIILSMPPCSSDGRCSFRTKEGPWYWLAILGVACSAVNSQFKLKLLLLNGSADIPIVVPLPLLPFSLSWV